MHDDAGGERKDAADTVDEAVLENGLKLLSNLVEDHPVGTSFRFRTCGLA